LLVELTTGCSGEFVVAYGGTGLWHQAAADTLADGEQLPDSLALGLGQLAVQISTTALKAIRVVIRVGPVADEHTDFLIIVECGILPESKMGFFFMTVAPLFYFYVLKCVLT
jgi:hypothetical protein